MQPRAVDVHDELLVARAPVTRALEDQAPTVAAEIRFGVLATIRELADVRQVSLTSGGRDGDHCGHVRRAGYDARDTQHGEQERTIGRHGPNVKRAPFSGRPFLRVPFAVRACSAPASAR